MLLEARENPFRPVFNIPKVEENSIPLLDIKTHQAFQDTRKIPLIKTSKNVEQNISIAAAPIKCIPQKPIMITTPCQTKSDIPNTKKPRKKHHKARSKSYQKLYQNYFLKVLSNGKTFKIYTSDILISQTRFSHPRKIALDFQRLQYFRTKTISLKSPFAYKIKFGSHHDFYRITLELKGKHKTKVLKKPYGYLLTFY